MRYLLSVLMLTASVPLLSQDDCDLFNIQELSAAYLNFTVDSIILQPDGSYKVHLSNGTTYTFVQGCTDPAYTEYDSSANTDDGSCSTLVVEGCTISAFTEYNASANTNDGSCSTLVVEGCTDPAYTEYNASANTDDGSCSTLVVVGCTDPFACNFNAQATVNFSALCTFGDCDGCNDPDAMNYNPTSTNDAACEYCVDLIAMDGYSYSTIQIGDQCWFAENLRTTVYADGTPIPEVTDGTAWLGLSSGARSDYDNDASNVATYGRLYNWYAATDAAGLCPTGWHVPTDDEWTALETYLGANGHSGAEGTALKSTSGWSNSGNGTDDFGFSALPGGFRDGDNGSSYNTGYVGYWWSSSPSGGNAWYRYLFSSYPVITRINKNPRFGFSARCLRDAD